MTLPFDHTHDLDLGVSRSESEIALFQELGGRLIMNKKDVSHPFITMIMTGVTMVRWADVPDSDRGDFRRRRAVDISSSECPAMSPHKIPWLFPDHFVVFPDHETYYRHFITALTLILQAIWQITHQK